MMPNSISHQSFHFRGTPSPHSWIISTNDMHQIFLSLVLITCWPTLVSCSNDVVCWPFCDSDSSSGVDDEDTGDEDTEDESTITNINLIGPNGGETFELIGSSQPLQIRWMLEGSFPIEGSIPVLVDLYKSGSYYLRIEQNPNTSTGTRWTPPKALPPGSGYQVKIFSALNHGVYDLSESEFTLSLSE